MILSSVYNKAELLSLPKDIETIKLHVQWREGGGGGGRVGNQRVKETGNSMGGARKEVEIAISTIFPYFLGRKRNREKGKIFCSAA